MADLCHTCRAPIAGYDSVHYGSIETGYRDLCSRCFNEEVASLGDLDFQHVNFEPVEMPDAGGQMHRFHFRLHLLGDRVSLEAFELKDGAPGGYQFQMLDDAEADLFAVMGQLIDAGADLAWVDSDGNTCLDLALAAHDDVAAKFLRDHGAVVLKRLPDGTQTTATGGAP